MKQYGAKTIILAILLQLAITFVVAAACGLVCAVFMLPLGFQYDGLWTIVVFFFFGSVLSPPPLPGGGGAAQGIVRRQNAAPVGGAAVLSVPGRRCHSPSPGGGGPGDGLRHGALALPGLGRAGAGPALGSRTSGRKRRSSGKPPPSPGLFHRPPPPRAGAAARLGAPRERAGALHKQPALPNRRAAFLQVPQPLGVAVFQPAGGGLAEAGGHPGHAHGGVASCVTVNLFPPEEGRPAGGPGGRGPGTGAAPPESGS